VPASEFKQIASGHILVKRSDALLLRSAEKGRSLLQGRLTKGQHG
jgi:hypothetical protein